MAGNAFSAFHVGPIMFAFFSFLDAQRCDFPQDLVKNLIRIEKEEAAVAPESEPASESHDDFSESD